MNINEFERMISLADEKYVDEIFEDRIYGKRKSIFLTLGAVAAALTVTIGGISYFVSTAGNDDIAMTDRSTVMIDDIADPEVTNITETVVPVSYEDFFKNKGGEFSISFYCRLDNEFGNDSQNAFDAEYAKSVIPFNTEGYSDERNQFYAYCDGNNEPYGISLYLESEFDETASPKFRGINIYICDKGKLEHNFPLEEAKPVNCFGTDIYGFDDTASYYEGTYDRNLKAYFVIGNTEYAVETCNLSCEETVNIIRDIIQSGFSVTDFDLSESSGFDHEVTSISLDEANMTEPFAGYIPQVYDVLVLYEGPHYEIVKINGEIYCQTLSFSYTDGTDSEDGKRILFEYYTKSTGRGAKPFENTIGLSDITLETLNEFAAGGEYEFTVNCHDFMINVTAKCASDELWAYIKDIRGDTYNNTITLVEAASTPFAEFVPKTEKIGDLVVGNIYLEKEKGWDNPTLTMDYSSQGRVGTFSYYGLVYHMDQQRVLEKVVTIDSITKEYIEQLAAETSGIGNNRSFDFSIDCGGIWINVHGDCTADEIWAFIENIKGNVYDTVTYDEAKAIEPFALYVPERESGSMKLEKGILNYYDDNGRQAPLSLHFMFSDGTSQNRLVITYERDFADFLNIPAENIIPIENIDWTAVNNFVENKKTFYIVCDRVIILVDADCDIDQVWFYIDQIKRKVAFDAAEKDGKLITMDKVKELAKKGDDLMWDDFESYYGVDVGSGIYIMAYSVEDTDYTVAVGGVPGEKPWYVRLENGVENYIDIRYESIDEFLKNGIATNSYTAEQERKLAEEEEQKLRQTEAAKAAKANNT